MHSTSTQPSPSRPTWCPPRGHLHLNVCLCSSVITLLKTTASGSPVRAQLSS
ncbi:hypothetical protein GQ607_013708 [Colletotrichum asianum]|uniref:Uncharacterized protein n=1 Tax=Colletotrichum asianum TaxID=702518 RepID=A0A8H3ZKH2_9PEZI|nr:hypothetical protein GQ607_013708 [Colletotrichum asianum]